MRKGINFAQLPATFPRKVSKENISNNRYHASKDIDMFMQIKSVKRNIRREKEKPRLNVHRAYLNFGFLLNVILFKALPRKFYGFQTPRLTRSCGCL